MADAVVVAQGLSRDFRQRHRRPGLWGALVDLVAPVVTTRRVVDGVDLTVHAGEVVGLLGRNGAGKSTVVKCLVGLLQPDGGAVRVDGLVPFDDRTTLVRRIGVVFGQRSALWWDLAVREGLDLLAALHGLGPETAPRRAALVARLDIADLLDRPVRELSLGQRVRCDLVAALQHAPRAVFLDEPTIGLDAAVRRRVRAAVRAMADDGVAVLLTTHDLADVAALCDRVVLLDAGRVVFTGTVPELRARFGGEPRTALVEPDLDTLLADFYEGAR